MSNTEKKILIFLVIAFVVGNIILLVKRGALQRDLAHFNIEEAVDRVAINRASLEELQMLPGIGQILAQRIIVYRERHGNFQKIEDLLKVEGISRKTLKQLEALVILE